jgi:hypothetical protein
VGRPLYLEHEEHRPEILTLSCPLNNHQLCDQENVNRIRDGLHVLIQMDDFKAVWTESVVQAALQGQRPRKPTEEKNNLRLLATTRLIQEGRPGTSDGSRQCYLDHLALELLQLFLDQIHGSFKASPVVVIHLFSVIPSGGGYLRTCGCLTS